MIDGDREMTLNFLWRLILHFQLPQLVDPHAVRIEIERINGAVGAAAGPRACSDHVGLLLQWAQAVCAQYGEAVPNFTSAFANGHLFCLMVNYYLGNAYLPRTEIYVPERPAQQPQSPASSRSSSDEEDGLRGDAGAAGRGGSFQSENLACFCLFREPCVFWMSHTPLTQP